MVWWENIEEKEKVRKTGIYTFSKKIRRRTKLQKLIFSLFLIMEAI